MKIALTGFMGTGKTSVGRELAKLLRYRFVDTDDLIEERDGMTISMICRKRGEAHFRSVERYAVMQVSTETRIVIATSVGCIMDP